jgi:hypothetical protein
MSSLALSALKRKSMEEPEKVASSNSEEIKSKARRVSTDTTVPSIVSTTSTIASHQTPGESSVLALANTTSASSTIAAPNSLMEIIGALIQDLAHSDNARVNVALDVLNLDFMRDKKKRESLITAGGCLALVHLTKNCLDKAIDIIPACDQVTELWELNELAELATLHKTLNVIIILTFQHDESRVGIAAIGGVEAVVKAMNTFPKCHALQERACGALRNLACCGIGKKKVAEKGGIAVLLAAVNNHLGSAMLCQKGCWALYNIVNGSKQNTELLISFGGGATVAKVRTKWPDNDDVLFHVRRLASLIASEMKAWVDEE